MVIRTPPGQIYDGMLSQHPLKWRWKIWLRKWFSIPITVCQVYLLYDSIWYSCRIIGVWPHQPLHDIQQVWWCTVACSGHVLCNQNIGANSGPCKPCISGALQALSLWGPCQGLQALYLLGPCQGLQALYLWGPCQGLQTLLLCSPYQGLQTLYLWGPCQGLQTLLPCSPYQGLQTLHPWSPCQGLQALHLCSLYHSWQTLTFINALKTSL